MTRSLKILSNFLNHSELKNATEVKSLELDFKPSTHTFHGIGETFPNVINLWILNQPIKYIEREIFFNMSQLTALTLNFNQIEFLPVDVFVDLPNVEYLSISGNRIKKLPEKLFNSMRKTKRIQFFSNRIEYLPKDLFISNVELQEVDFTYNPLKKVYVDFTNLANLWSLRLENSNCVNSYSRYNSQVADVQHYINENCTALKSKKNMSAALSD